MLSTIISEFLERQITMAQRQNGNEPEKARKTVTDEK